MIPEWSLRAKLGVNPGHFCMWSPPKNNQNKQTKNQPGAGAISVWLGHLPCARPTHVWPLAPYKGPRVPPTATQIKPNKTNNHIQMEKQSPLVVLENLWKSQLNLVWKDTKVKWPMWLTRNPICIPWAHTNCWRDGKIQTNLRILSRNIHLGHQNPVSFLIIV